MLACVAKSVAICQAVLVFPAGAYEIFFLIFNYRYVNGISAVLSSSVPAISALLSPLYYQFFLDKVKFHPVSRKGFLA